MNRERVLLFTGVVLALLLIPTVLPYLLGGILLPIWAYLMYASIVLVNAALYLMNRCILIDRYLVPGGPCPSGAGISCCWSRRSASRS